MADGAKSPSTTSRKNDTITESCGNLKIKRAKSILKKIIKIYRYLIK